MKLADERIRNAFESGIAARLPLPLRRFAVRTARVVYAVGRDVSTGPLSLHASGISYTTLVSLVPLLALSFSVLKGLGADQELQPLLLRMLAPLGSGAESITAYILDFVTKVDVGVLGAVGLAFLAYTAISVVQKIEKAFNEVWRIDGERSWSRKFTDYLSVLMVGPMLLVAGFGIIGSARERVAEEYPPDQTLIGSLLEQALGFGPLVVLLLAFTALYALLPNTRVRFSAAFAGAVVAGFLWIAAGKIFAAFVATSASYTAIYAAFASVILFLIWLQLSWLIVLIGASTAFYVQNPAYLRIKGQTAAFSARARLRLGLAVIALIVKRQYRGEALLSATEIATDLEVPTAAVEDTLVALAGAGLLLASADTPARYVLMVPAETTSLQAVVNAIRQDGEADAVGAGAIALAGATVPAIEAAIDRALATSLAGRTLKDLADAATGDGT